MCRGVCGIIVLILLLLLFPFPSQAQSLNHFDIISDMRFETRDLEFKLGHFRFQNSDFGFQMIF